MREPTHNIRDPTRLLAMSEPTGECVCAPGQKFGVLKTTLISQLYPIEVWASCDHGTDSVDRPYNRACNRMLMNPGESSDFPQMPVSMYDPMGAHIHVRVANELANVATPHYNGDDGMPWLQVPMDRCTC